MLPPELMRIAGRLTAAELIGHLIDYLLAHDHYDDFLRYIAETLKEEGF